jgi:hypothetical protein
VSLFGDALGTIIDEIHRAQGSPVVSYTSFGFSPVSIAAVWDAPHRAIDLATGELSDVEPSLGVQLSDLSAAVDVDRDTLTIDAIAYRVTDSQPDGQGGARLALRKVI